MSSLSRLLHQTETAALQKPVSSSVHRETSSKLTVPNRLTVRLQAPVIQDIGGLAPGFVVLLSGTIYTARDAAHKKMIETLEQGEALPFDPQDQIIYYTGPTPTREGQTIGSAGPTSSYRMDPYTPALLELGLKGCIGKGERSPECMAAFAQFGAKYFLAIGGTGALISKCIRSSRVIAYEEMGTEAIRELQVEDMRLIVA
ncbi:fumarate hydratase C-terminal domain-containing protein [Candidatus Haliotispira prima]|uniref:Fumarate hydratase C-terminal domain-containing protein n=1 Tax=Candidatus Haliotispira prima TaxID=3034016 RepID=A0ABY8MF12_9SPIO|nr:fumarate hydratase C-terminal domain-containing protein [Candidatus Haliotispira prima]